MIRRLSIIILLCLFGCSGLSAQNADPLGEIMEYLEGKAFTVHIVIRLLDSDEELVWDVEHTEVTVSGRALNVRLVGDDIVIDAFLAPFGSIESDLMIVAYGQLWFTDGPERGVRYESFMKSLPVELGERVILLPLGGVAVDSETNTYYTIQLEIQLLPYQNDSGVEEQTE